MNEFGQDGLGKFNTHDQLKLKNRGTKNEAKVTQPSEGKNGKRGSPI